MLLSQRGVTRYASRSLRAQLQTKAGEIRLENSPTSPANIRDGNH